MATRSNGNANSREGEIRQLRAGFFGTGDIKRKKRQQVTYKKKQKTPDLS